jgi:hypothetical protein
MPLLNDDVIVSVCAELAVVSELAQAICDKPVQELVDEINCKNKFLSAVAAVIVTFMGPPVTVKVYHPSRRNVPTGHVPIVGVLCVASVIVPLAQEPFIVIATAVAQVAPCALISFVNKTDRNKVKRSNQELVLKRCRLAVVFLISFVKDKKLK